LATAYKILGRGTGGPAPATTVYTVPTGKVAVISTLSVSNNAGSSNNVNVYLTDTAGTSAATSNALLYSAAFAVGSRASFTWGLTLTAGQTLKINAGASATLIVFGSEIDA